METKDLTNVKNFDYSGEKLFDTAQDFLPINGTDYVELYLEQGSGVSKSLYGTPDGGHTSIEGFLARAA